MPRIDLDLERLLLLSAAYSRELLADNVINDILDIFDGVLNDALNGAGSMMPLTFLLRTS